MLRTRWFSSPTIVARISRLDHAADIDEGHHRAVHRAVRGAVGQQPHQVLRAAVAHRHAALEGLLLLQHAGDVLAEVHLVQSVGEIGQRPATVAGLQVDDGADGRREAADQHVPVEEHRGDPGALEQVAQVGIRPVQLLQLGRKLQVDGAQFPH